MALAFLLLPHLSLGVLAARLKLAKKCSIWTAGLVWVSDLFLGFVFFLNGKRIGGKVFFSLPPAYL